MIAISFLTGELLLAAVWLMLRAALWLRQGGVDWRREAVLLLMYVNLAVILRFTFFPMSRAAGKVQPLLFDPAEAFPFRVNPVPFVNLLDFDKRRDLVLNIIGNVCMFIPSGIVLPIVYKKLDCFRKVLAVGFMISLCIEIIQLPFSVRASDVDDLLLNTLGVVIGYGVPALVRRFRKSRAAV